MHLARIHLKTSCIDRKELINYCLENENKYLAIGWSCVYEIDNQIDDYEKYYFAVKDYAKSYKKRLNHALNVFRNAEYDDLFWTRDLDGFYWICRVIGTAKPYLNSRLDIGAVLPVEAYKVGLDIPGRIKASFNRPRGGIAEYIYEDEILQYSMSIFNEVSDKKVYEYETVQSDILDSLPDLDLEQLVISYLQIKEDYYLLSNSIAKRSTTIKIECELMSRNRNNIRKAVVQVKGGNNKVLDAFDFKEYVDDGYYVYLYAPIVRNVEKNNRCIRVTKEELRAFVKEYRELLPKSIIKWENLFTSNNINHNVYKETDMQ